MILVIPVVSTVIHCALSRDLNAFRQPLAQEMIKTKLWKVTRNSDSSPHQWVWDCNQQEFYNSKVWTNQNLIGWWDLVSLLTKSRDCKRLSDWNSPLWPLYDLAPRAIAPTPSDKTQVSYPMVVKPQGQFFLLIMLLLISFYTCWLWFYCLTILCPLWTKIAKKLWKIKNCCVRVGETILIVLFSKFSLR